MAEILDKSANIHAEMQPFRQQEAAIEFMKGFPDVSTTLVGHTITERDQLRELCHRKLEDLDYFGHYIDLDPSDIPFIRPPYGPQLQRLDFKLNECQQILEERIEQVKEYYYEAAQIAKYIGVEPPLMPGSYHLDQINALKTSLKGLQKECIKRIARRDKLINRAVLLFKVLGFNTMTLVRRYACTDLRDDKLVMLKDEIEDLVYLRVNRLKENKQLRSEIEVLGKYVPCEIDLSPDLTTSNMKSLNTTKAFMRLMIEPKMRSVKKRDLNRLDNHANKPGPKTVPKVTKRRAGKSRKSRKS